MVRLGLVFAGEIWVMFAAAKIGWVCWLTLELRSPTTPMTVSSAASLVAAFLPTSALASSSTEETSSFQPGTALVSLACLTASSTECWMPLPRADRSPVSGAMTPILTVLVAPPVLPPLEPPESPREPQAERASAATASGTPIRTMERWCTDPPGSFGRGGAPRPRRDNRERDAA